MREALFPGDADLRFRTPYDLHDTGLLRGLLADAGFRELRIETRRIPIVGADPHRLAAGQVLGTPRAALIAQRGVDPQSVIGAIAAALARAGGNPYHGYGQAILVEAQAA